MISEIQNEAFLNLLALLILDLSNNILFIFTPAVIINCFELEGIIFQNTTIYIPQVHIIQNLGIGHLISDNYFHCCFMPPNRICTASSLAPWYFSCTDLLVNNGVKIYFVFMSLMILFVNSFSFLGQLLSIQYTKNKAMSALLVLTLNITDLAYGIYFLILWVADLHYQGRFAIDEKEWKSGLMCFTALSICLTFLCCQHFFLHS